MSYNPSVGRWMQQDPEGYIDGADAYQFEDSNSIDRLDPSGTDATVGSGNKTYVPYPFPNYVADPPGLVNGMQAQPPAPGMIPYSQQTDPQLATTLADLEQRKNQSYANLNGGTDSTTAWLWQQIQAVKTEQASRELEAIRQAADSASVGVWIPYVNECGEMSAKILAAIQAKFGGNTKYWSFNIAQGKGKFLNHQVVEVDPMPGNPMPAQVIDGTVCPAVGFSPFTSAYPLNDFKQSYPNKIDK